jgi:undecaprenyl-diphosphatase
MHDIIKAIILGIVEGITEFLPISSTGHLILVNKFIFFKEHFTKMFDIVIQFGAIVSVLVYFRERLFSFKFQKNMFTEDPTVDLWKKVIVGVLPALVLGALLDKYIEEKLFNPTVVSIALVIGGIILVLLESRKKHEKIVSISELSYLTAFFIGLIQCLAMIPGTSRSAATIIGAMLLGCSRLVAAEFSFFLAIPTILAASAYSLLKLGFSMTTEEAVVLSVGFLVSFIVAWVVIAAFMGFISKRNFKPFGYYRIVLGGLILIYVFVVGTEM